MSDPVLDPTVTNPPADAMTKTQTSSLPAATPEISAASKGSRWGSIAGVVIVMAFFLPWVRACNADLTGYEIATDSSGRIEAAGIYWLTFLAGLFCIALYYRYKAVSQAERKRAAIARLVAGIIGFLPLLNIWANIRQQGRAIEILYGGWLEVIGYLGVFLSVFIDLRHQDTVVDETEKRFDSEASGRDI